MAAMAADVGHKVVPGLCLNPTAQKDNRGVPGSSFRAEEFSEIVGYSNMADYTLSVRFYLPGILRIMCRGQSSEFFGKCCKFL